MKLIHNKQIGRIDIKSTLHNYNHNKSDFMSIEDVSMAITQNYKLYEHNDYVKDPFWFRISYPIVYLIMVIMLLTIMPIKYFITGKFYFNQDNRFIKFIRRWE